MTRSRASFESMNSFSSWIYCKTSTHACDFEIPLKGLATQTLQFVTPRPSLRFRSSAVVNLVASTSDPSNLMIWEWFMVVTLKEEGTIPFRSHKSTSKVSSMISKNVVRVFLYILEVFHLKLNTFKQSLGWNRVLQKFHVYKFWSVELFRNWILLSATWMFLYSDL